MPQGLQVFDENGLLLLDVASNTTRFLGNGNTGGVDGEISDPNITANSKVWVVVYPNAKTTSNYFGYRQPRFTIETGLLKWVVSPNGSGTATGNLAPLDFIYGVY